MSAGLCQLATECDALATTVSGRRATQGRTFGVREHGTAMAHARLADPREPPRPRHIQYEDVDVSPSRTGRTR
jgi:hypothetical protein